MIWKAIQSLIAAGAQEGDELIVVGDGPQLKVREGLRRVQSCLSLRYAETRPTHVWGHHQRNVGMGLARGSHLIFRDDDDETPPDGLTLIRSVAAQNPGKLLMFRLTYVDEKGAKVLGPWYEKKIQAATGNGGGSNIVVPNVPEQFGAWFPGRGGDARFIQQTVDRWPGGAEAVAWREESVIDYHKVYANKKRYYPPPVRRRRS